MGSKQTELKKEVSHEDFSYPSRSHKLSGYPLFQVLVKWGEPLTADSLGGRLSTRPLFGEIELEWTRTQYEMILIYNFQVWPPQLELTKSIFSPESESF